MFNFHPNESFAVFIDGANAYGTTKAIGMDMDYKKLRLYFTRQDSRLVRIYYYTAMLPENEFNSIQPLVDWLDFNGYSVVTKPAKEFTDKAGVRRVKGNMDIEMAIDILEMSSHIQHAVLFTGDGDFRHLVEVIQRKGVRVTVVSTMKFIADELRRQADEYVDLEDFRVLVERARNEA
jgi:uncharacterized LabA/DUF88 family protein